MDKICDVAEFVLTVNVATFKRFALAQYMFGPVSSCGTTKVH